MKRKRTSVFCVLALLAVLLPVPARADMGPKPSMTIHVENPPSGIYYLDLLVPGIGELCGASQREERYDVLLNRIRELGLNEEDYWWYLDLRRFGGNKHAGFGLGFERMVMYLTGISNIRDVLPFPRTTGSAEF